VGLFFILCAKEVGEEGKVIAIEPFEDNIKNLEKNLKFNNINNVIIVPKGTFHKPETLNFYIHAESFCHSIKTDELKINPQKIKKIIKIKVDTVENVLNELNIPYYKIKFVKIDNEGAELETLKGMKNILSKNKDIKIIIPDLEEDDNNYKEILDLLIENGFKIHTKYLPMIYAEK